MNELEPTEKIDEAPAPSNPQDGKVGWALAWLVGIPIPVLLVIYLVAEAC